MTKQEFFDGALFEAGDGYEYLFRRSAIDGYVGSVRRRLIGQDDWNYIGNVFRVGDAGFYVFDYCFGKYRQQFVRYSKLTPQPAKHLAAVP